MYLNLPMMFLPFGKKHWVKLDTVLHLVQARTA